MADLSGNWLGSYWQDDIPSRFEVTFVQSGNTFSGSILDDNYLGEAQVNGEVIGRTVSFTKRYCVLAIPDSQGATKLIYYADNRPTATSASQIGIVLSNNLTDFA